MIDPKTKKCKECGTEFILYNSIEKYCGYECKAKNAKPPKNKIKKPKQAKPRKKPVRSLGGSYDYNASKIAKKQKQLVGYTYCEDCQRSDRPQQTHHIIYRSEMPGHEHIHNIRNLIRLCKPCHDSYHDYKPKRIELIHERKLIELFGKSIL